jgi:hypothetical protein
MSNFRVAITNGIFSLVSEEEVPETDIIDLLEFDETQIESLYKTHAAVQARWEQLAINYNNRYDLFKNEFEKSWWAHNKKFAKLLSLAYGEKTPTMESIKDNVIMIYSENTAESLRQKYAMLAYDAYSKRGGVHHDTFEDFSEDMYKYVSGTSVWYYEALVRSLSEMKKQVETLQNIAKRLEARSFHMKDLKELVMEKHGNVGPMSDVDRAQSMQSFAPKMR